MAEKLAAHVEQALNELENGEAYENAGQVTAARKRLTAAGLDDRQIAAARRARAADTSGDEPAVRQAPPRGRSATATGAATTSGDGKE